MKKKKSRKNGLVLKLKLIVNLVVGIQMLSEYIFDFKKFKSNHFWTKALNIVKIWNNFSLLEYFFPIKVLAKSSQSQEQWPDTFS